MNPTPRRLPGELVFTLLLLAGSAFLLREAYGISKFESFTSPGVFPMLAAAVMVLTALLALRGTLRQARPQDSTGESLALQFGRRMAPPVLLSFVLAIAAYMLLLQPLGFLVASYGFLVVSMRLLGSRRWGLNLLVGATSLAAIYLVFQTLFAVVLPSGDWLMGVLR